MPMERDGSGLPGLDVEVCEDGHGVLLLRLRGEIDLLTAPILDRSLTSLAERDGATQVVADLSGVSFVGIVGVETLGRHAMRLSEEGRRLVVVSPSALTRRVIGLLGLDEHLGAARSEPSPDGISSSV
ncbi:MAG TPA: STAS domain-containing protein [Acidimicrobiales bacterium]|jgi:anti-sigma B factor antagonist|nr:STAS domain-containing protein [Acidimicrobiales bacterium]